MRKVAATLVVLLIASALVAPGVVSAASRPPAKVSVPGQIQVGTVNAHQNKILGLKRFEAMLALARGFRERPPAFNGGYNGAVTAPDVLVITEFRPSNVEIFARLVREKYDMPYEIAGTAEDGPTVDAQAALIINTDTVVQREDVVTYPDVCLNSQDTEVRRLRRSYVVGRFTEVGTDAPFSVAGVHLARDYAESGEADCMQRNIDATRAQLENDPGATFIAGDFNQRAMESLYECDSNENSAPRSWWLSLTEPQGGQRVYLDSVRDWHRSTGTSMAEEWTFQHKGQSQLCSGLYGARRARIDYIFTSGALVAEAHADHPGWTDPGNPRYSDHRFVIGRFVLMGPPQPPRVGAVPDAGGVVHLTWQTVPEVTGWRLYRAHTGRAYQLIAELPPEQLAYDDVSTAHGNTYRYAIAPLAVNGAQGLESRATFAKADARGPQVSGIDPPSGATGVGTRVRIRVAFDEFVDADSVTPSTISLYRNGTRIPGQVIRKGGFVLYFDPAFPLRKGETFTVVVRPVSDTLGNIGETFRSRFSTVEPPKKKPRRR